MNYKTIFFVIFLFLLSVHTRTFAQDSRLINFTLEDQFGKTHSQKEYINKVVIMIGSDRAGSKYNASWGEALGKSLEKHPKYNKIVFLGLADVRGVPSFFRWLIKHNFPKNRSVLMDWKGVLATAYKFESKHSNIMVFAPGGKLVISGKHKEVKEEVLKKIVTEVNHMIDKL